MHMKRISTIIMAALAVLSCKEPVLNVTDRSFEFTSKVDFVTETMRARLTLTKTRGADTEYTVTCSIDGDPTLLLEDVFGNALPSRFTADFSQGPALAWTLPRLSFGQHAMDIDIHSGNVSQSLHEEFAIETDSFTVHAEVKADARDDRSSLLVSLTDGIRDRRYEGMVYLDGDEDGGIAFGGNFGSSPIISVPLPLLRPGRHEAEVRLSDGIATETTSLPFDEPMRHPVIDIHLSHNPGSGKTMMTVGPNPYAIIFTVRDSLTVKGVCDYHRASSSEGNTITYHEEKTLTDVASIGPLAPTEGTKYMLADRESTEKAMEEYAIENTTWKEVWKSDGEGYWAYSVVSDGMSHYRVISSVDRLEAVIEKVEGVTAVVHCSEDGFIWNGVTLSGADYSFRL